MIWIRIRTFFLCYLLSDGDYHLTILSTKWSGYNKEKQILIFRANKKKKKKTSWWSLHWILDSPCDAHFNLPFMIFQIFLRVVESEGEKIKEEDDYYL